MTSPALLTRGLTKRYGEREVVRDLNLQVDPGEVVGLLGPNGAGKTTSFNMIVGGTRPTRGRVFVGEEELTELPMYQRARLGVVYLPQDPSIFRKLSVEDNIDARFAFGRRETPRGDHPGAGAGAEISALG
jgi:lipopolysaccharide export system ATP-binding protein